MYNTALLLQQWLNEHSQYYFYSTSLLSLSTVFIKTFLGSIIIEWRRMCLRKHVNIVKYEQVKASEAKSAVVPVHTMKVYWEEKV